MRVGDSDRDAAVVALTSHRSAGRLPQGELDDRIAMARQARVRADLDVLFRDLPGGWEPDPGGSGAATQVGRTSSGEVTSPPGGPRDLFDQTAAGAVRVRRSFADRLTASSGTLAVVVFFLLGFGFDAWAWAWVVFLLPGVVAAWRD